jgi:gamma-glutamyltranspeptidase/glutathione hydrolase
MNLPQKDDRPDGAAMMKLNWTFPYTSQRMPVFARSVVATSQPLAAQAGLQIMRNGGNAVDAAVATAVAMTVLEPTSNGIGSDAFALIWIDGKLHGLNASGRSARSLSPDRFAGQDNMPRRGWDPVTVPGAVSAWMECSKRFGRLPFAKLLEPAIELADKGYHVAPLTSGLWQRAEAAYDGFEEFKRTFLIDGRAPAPGQLVRLPQHAATLKEIAESRGESFYRGRLANAIADTAKSDGGLLNFNDLAAHSADWVEPLSIAYKGWQLHEIPPNGQGLAALLALGILRKFDLASLQVDCPDVIHLQIEAMKLAFADAHRYIADPRFMSVQANALLGDDYIASRAALINPSRAQNFEHGQPKPGGTILLTTADSSGGMVSFIQSNYTGFGSGIVIPGTGIAMQNRGACFTLEKGHPNEVGGAKRPYHTIIPAFVTRDGAAGPEPVMAFGVMGGFMQPQGHIQVVIRMADFGQNPQAALDAPRWQVTEGMKITIEPGFDASLYDDLKNRGHVIDVAGERSVTFGRGQAIYRLDDGGYCGASDSRGDGQAVGW